MDSEKPYSHNSPPKSLSCNEDDVAIKCRGHLPSDLLESIADRLGMIELLHFRSVCKDWYSASSSSSAQIECFRDPWLLLYGENSQCTLFTDFAKKYTLNVPELEDGATCIASDKGWLLVLKNGSIYFFCPFSGAKIVLPELPITDYWDYLAAFSSPPTSPDCKVCFFRHDRSSGSREVYVLFRGETSWTKDVLKSKRAIDFKTVRAASFDGDEVYIIDEAEGLIIYNIVKKNDAEVLRIVQKTTPGSRQLPFYAGRKYLSEKRMVPELTGGRFSLTTCGTRLVSQERYDTVVYGETIDVTAFHGEEEEEQPMARKLKGVWIHPRYFQVSPSYQW